MESTSDFPLRDATPEECAELKALFETILQVPIHKDYPALVEKLRATYSHPFAITANVTEIMTSWEEVVEKQWKLLWPLMDKIILDDPIHVRMSMDCRIAICAFTSVSRVSGIPTMYRNSCIVMRTAREQPWRMVHFHVSRDPRVPGPAETFESLRADRGGHGHA